MVYAEELPARVPPKGLWKTPEEVIQFVANIALRLPGVTRTKFLGRWAAHKSVADQNDESTVVLGSFTDEFLERAFERAADVAERLWKVRPTDIARPVPSVIPTREWFELLRVELERERGWWRDSHG
jgi:hypothetical protein